MALEAGFAHCDITPPVGCALDGYSARDRGSSGLEDSLEGRAVVIRNGDRTIAIACADLLGVDKESADEIRSMASNATGIPVDSIMVCATHTHFGPCYRKREHMPAHLAELVPDGYQEDMVKSLAGAIIEAAGNLEPVRIGYGCGRAHGITFNRRPADSTRHTQQSYTLPPSAAVAASRVGAQLADAWPRYGHLGPRLSAPVPEMDGLHAGVTDNEVPLLRIEGLDGQPVASLFSFACHAVVGRGDGYDISPDYPGRAREAFEDIIGGPAIAAAGCAGDQVPTWRRGDARERVGKSLGAEAAKAWYRVEELQDNLLIDAISEEVAIPVPPHAPQLEESMRNAAEFEGQDTPEARHARKLLARAQEIDGRSAILRPIWAGRIGDMGIVGLPGEILVEIGMQIKQRSPFRYTQVISLSNAYLGYLCTDRAFEEGGYEPGNATLMFNCNGAGTEKALVETALEMLNALRNRE